MPFHQHLQSAVARKKPRLRKCLPPAQPLLSVSKVKALRLFKYLLEASQRPSWSGEIEGLHDEKSQLLSTWSARAAR